MLTEVQKRFVTATCREPAQQNENKYRSFACVYCNRPAQNMSETLASCAKQSNSYLINDFTATRMILVISRNHFIHLSWCCLYWSHVSSQARSWHTNTNFRTSSFTCMDRNVHTSVISACPGNADRTRIVYLRRRSAYHRRSWWATV